MRCEMCGNEILEGKPVRLSFEAPQNPQRKTDSQLMCLSTTTDVSQPVTRRTVAIGENCFNKHEKLLTFITENGFASLKRVEEA